MNGCIKLDSASIQRAKLPITNKDQTGQTVAGFLPKIDADGIYRIHAIDYSGNTRELDWYCNVVCIALDGTVPLHSIGRGGTASPETAAAGPLRPQPWGKSSGTGMQFSRVTHPM